MSWLGRPDLDRRASYKLRGVGSEFRVRDLATLLLEQALKSRLGFTEAPALVLAGQGREMLLQVCSGLPGDLFGQLVDRSLVEVKVSHAATVVELVFAAAHAPCHSSVACDRFAHVIHPDRRSHHTEEVEAMPSEDSAPNGGKVKTLAIRLEPDVHAQLSLIAQLRSSTITDEIRQAIDSHIVATKSAPELANQADAVLEEIERDAASRREAIATLFGSESSQQTGGGRTRGRKSGKEEAPPES